MSRRGWVLLCVGVLAVLTGLGVRTLVPERPRSLVSRESFDRIQARMTQAEVEALLGGPPGNYIHDRGRRGFRDSRPYADLINRGLQGAAAPSVQYTARIVQQIKMWWGDEVTVVLRFDDDGKVADKALVETAPIDESPRKSFRR